jgi:queuosine precursor transporter
VAHALINKLTARDRRLGSFRYYEILVNIFVVVLLISNLVGQKIVAIPLHLGSWHWTANVSGAQVLFPITYIFGDVFTEVYGYSGSRRAIWMGFFCSLLMMLMGLFVVALPADSSWHNQGAFQAVFYVVPRMIAASLIAFWCGEFANSYTLAKMKLWTDGRMLWTRTIGSTVVGQFVDSILVMVLAFSFTLPWHIILNLIISGYLAKVIYEAAATPFTYLIVNSLKRAEGVDVYDQGTDFNPFGAEAIADKAAS